MQDVSLVSPSKLTFVVKSHTKKKKFYDVKHAPGKWVCSCQSYKYKNSKEYFCKHIKDVLKWLKIHKLEGK